METIVIKAFLLSILLVLHGCYTQPVPVPEPVNKARAIVPTGDTGVQLTPITVLFIGQSNCNNAHSVSVQTVPNEARIIHNGAEIPRGSPYPSLFGPQANVAADLIAAGFSPTIISECYNGMAIQSLMDNAVPWLIASVSATMGTYPETLEPDEIVIVHGEQDGTNSNLALAYQGKLIGPSPEGSQLPLLDQLRGAFPGARILITEVRVRETITYLYTHWTRAAQHAAGLESDVCLVPTGGPDWDYGCELRSSTNPHYSQTGLECLGRRISDVIIQGKCL